MLPSSGEGLAPSERANIHHWAGHGTLKQIQFPKRCVFKYLEFRATGAIQKSNNSECYALSLETFGK
jgi:hypothetical protein